MSVSGNLLTMSESSGQAETNRTSLVLDTWPVMEWYRYCEPVTTSFRSLMRPASQDTLPVCMSRINLGEVFYSVAKDFGLNCANTLVQEFMFFPIEIVSVHDTDIDTAAHFKSRNKTSYADGFAAALSMERDAPLVTGDRDFLVLQAQGLLQVHWVGA